MPQTTAPTPASSRSVSVLVVRHCIAQGERLGIPRPLVLAAAGIGEEELAAGNNWLPAEVLERLMKAALAMNADPLLGLKLCREQKPAVFGVLGYLTQTCPTLLDMHHAVCNYERLISNFGHTTLHHEPGRALWCWACDSDNPLFIRHATEFILGGCAAVLHGQQPGALLEIHFQHEAPADATLLPVYLDWFHCPVRFNQPHSALVLRSQGLSQPLPHADPGLHDTLRQHAQKLLTELRSNEPTLVEQARRELRQMLLTCNPSRDLLAERLGMSGRNLHRQLEKLGSGYRELLDELRLELAQGYLQTSRQSIEEIAQRLHFQESYSFSRWFRQLAGMTPGEFRQQAPATSAS